MGCMNEEGNQKGRCDKVKVRPRSRKNISDKGDGNLNAGDIINVQQTNQNVKKKTSRSRRYRKEKKARNQVNESFDGVLDVVDESVQKGYADLAEDDKIFDVRSILVLLELD